MTIEALEWRNEVQVRVDTEAEQQPLIVISEDNSDEGENMVSIEQSEEERIVYIGSM